MYYTKTIFMSVIGSSQESKVLDYVITIRNWDFTLNDILTGTGINRNAGRKIVDRFVRIGILTEKEKKKKFYKNRKLKFYKINKNNKLAKALMDIEDEALKIQTNLMKGIKKMSDTEITKKYNDYWK